MKLIHTFVILLAAVMLLTSCARQTVSDTDTYWANTDITTREDGFYFFDNKNDGSKPPLTYIDFESLVMTAVCPKPNCTHTDPETCFALEYDPYAAIIQYGEKIYWFENETVYDDGEYKVNSNLMSAAKYGGERQSVTNIKNLRAKQNQLLVYDGKLWFIAEKVGFDEHGSNGKDYAYLYYYDFGRGKVNKAYDFSTHESDGCSGFASIIGMWNDDIIVDVGFDDDDNRRFQARLDPYNQSIEKFDFHVTSIYGEYIIGYYNDSNELMVLSLTGEEYKFGDSGISISLRALGSSIYNNKLFCFPDELVIDLKTGKYYELLISNFITTYTGGEYIVKRDILDENSYIVGTKFERLSESDVIGEEIT